MVFGNVNDENEIILNVNSTENNELREEYLYLLNRKLRLEKDAKQYEWSYIQTFGEQIERILELETECIKYKKLIAIYYRMLSNRERFNRDEALSELAMELKPYYDNIEYIKEVKSDKGEVVSDYKLTRIKKMYKRIVNVLHPDVNPELSKNETMKELWNLATIYYKCNDFEKLQETYMIIIDELEKLNIDIDDEIVIDNLEEKIEKVKSDIDNILNTDPYLYSLILEDEEMIKEKKSQLDDEIKEYDEYSKELKTELYNLGIDISDYNIV